MQSPSSGAAIGCGQYCPLLSLASWPSSGLRDGQRGHAGVGSELMQGSRQVSRKSKKHQICIAGKSDQFYGGFISSSRRASSFFKIS